MKNMILSSGTIIHKKYEILSYIGEGSSSQVYKAKDQDLNKLVALKFLKQELANLPHIRKQFIKESQIAANFLHKSIIQIHAILEWKTTLFIVMDYLEGKTLRQVLEERTLSNSDILDITNQLLLSLNQIHSKKIVHKDIKPSNIMITGKEGNYKLYILDLGLASSFQVEILKVASGTPKYMSPEQMFGNRADYKSDQFSSALCIYQMFTGKHPFEGENIDEIVGNIFQNNWKKISLYRKTPRLVDKVIRKALSFEMDHRYDDVEQFRQAFQYAFHHKNHIAKILLSILLLLILFLGYIFTQFKIFESQNNLSLSRMHFKEKRFTLAIMYAEKIWKQYPGEAHTIIIKSIWNQYITALQKKNFQKIERLLLHPVLKEKKIEYSIFILFIFMKKEKVI